MLRVKIHNNDQLCALYYARHAWPDGGLAPFGLPGYEGAYVGDSAGTGGSRDGTGAAPGGIYAVNCVVGGRAANVLEYRFGEGGGSVLVGSRGDE